MPNSPKQDPKKIATMGRVFSLIQNSDWGQHNLKSFTLLKGGNEIRLQFDDGEIYRIGMWKDR